MKTLYCPNCGRKLTKEEDLEHLLAVLDPAEDPDTWEYYHRKYLALIGKEEAV